MSPIACGCQKNRITADGTPVPSGTYRVMVSGRQAYESSAELAALAVGDRFTTAEIETPTGRTLIRVDGEWVDKESPRVTHPESGPLAP